MSRFWSFTASTPASLRGLEQLACLLDAPLVVVADLGDDEAVGVVGDPPAVDRQLAHGAIVAGARGRLDGRAATPITPFLPPADRDTVPQMPTTLSILMPVYNERARSSERSTTRSPPSFRSRRGSS